MSPSSDVPKVVFTGLASGLGPMLAVPIIWGDTSGEAFWLLPALICGSISSAVAGTLAGLWIVRARGRRSSPYRVAFLVWLVTASGALLLAAAWTLASFGTVTAWVAGPLIAGSALGAVPAALLAVRGLKQQP